MPWKREFGGREREWEEQRLGLSGREGSSWKGRQCLRRTESPGDNRTLSKGGRSWEIKGLIQARTGEQLNGGGWLTGGTQENRVKCSYLRTCNPLSSSENRKDLGISVGSCPGSPCQCGRGQGGLRDPSVSHRAGAGQGLRMAEYAQRPECADPGQEPEARGRQGSLLSRAVCGHRPYRHPAPNKRTLRGGECEARK